MMSLNQRLDMLQHVSPATVEKLLVDALRHAQPQEVSPICLRLVQTARPGAIEAVLRQASRLDESTLVELTRGATPFVKPALGALKRASSGNVEIIAELAVRRGEIRVLGALVERLNRESGALAGTLGDAIFALILECFQTTEPRAVRDGFNRQVDEALASALEAYPRHRQRQLLLAAALHHRRPGPRLASILNDMEHPVHFALRSVTEDLQRPEVRCNLLRWSDHLVFGPGVARRLHRLSGVRAYADLLQSGHLLLSAARRRALRRVDHPQRCLPAIQEATQLPPDAQRWLIVLIESLRPAGAATDAYLSDLIALPSPRARLAALQRLSAGRSEIVASGLRRFVADREPQIARLATRHVLRSRSDSRATDLATLECSPHSHVAYAARRQQVRGDAPRLFDRTGWLREADRIAAARALLAMRRDALLRALREELQSGARQRVLQSVQVIRRLAIGGAFEATLLGHVFNADPKIASSAVMALGETGTPHVVDAIRAALNHDDARVQANAVEALVRLDAPETGDLVSVLAGSADNRPRANAVWAMMRGRPADATDHLQAMLRDTNPLHRVSGLWLARRLRVRDMQGEIDRISTDDPLIEVRNRAALAARCLV